MKELFKHLQESINPILSESRTKEVLHIEMCYRVVERYHKAKRVNEDFADEHGIPSGDEAPKIEDTPKVGEPVEDGKAPVANEGSFEVTDELVDEIAKTLEISFEDNGIDREEFKKGLTVEQEHIDVTQNDPNITGQIALAHLNEIPDYYTRLATMEEEYKKEQEGVKGNEETEAKDGDGSEGEEKAEAVEQEEEKELGEAKVDELNMADMGAVAGEMATMKAKNTPFKPMGKDEKSKLPKGSNDCHCIVRHARSPEEREGLAKRLEYFRKIGDSHGIALTMAQLSGCPCDEGVFDQSGSIWGSHPPRRRTVVAEKGTRCPNCGADIKDEDALSGDTGYVCPECGNAFDKGR